MSKLDKLKFRDKKEAQAENFRKMIMAMVQDIRVILIKLADRTTTCVLWARCARINAAASP
ncbi:GTP pyrophosphokinase [Klebsiella pneumoniae]|uniref:GTP pyrophosphokinase n=1 Tax=Klebsiella pneumoniae TaxID=573 RepID=A0A377TLS5_KLEPN|nr:GTP pyrophosphokinase [Klebsiella pneumoniae]